MPRPLAFPIKKLIGFDADLWERVREYRFEARLNTESDAVRQLIEKGLGKSKPSRSGGATKPRSTGKSAGPRVKERQSS
jgi:hypothetical protein